LRLAIVVPTFDEMAYLEPLLSALRREADWVVVSDGGSRDGTLALAAAAGVHLVEGGEGRGAQLDRGGRLARDLGADALLFVHADTWLPGGAGEAVVAALEGGHVGGGFFLRFDDDRPIFRLGGRLVNLRTRLTRLPLGDQAQFVRGDLFDELEGFRPWPILEDLDFAWRLRRRGRIALLDPPVVTAARRFVEQGVARTVATNWLIWILFGLGVSPQRLGGLYRKIR